MSRQVASPGRMTQRADAPGQQIVASFGERIDIVDHLLGGKITRECVCQLYKIDEEELNRWVRLHARDRLIAIDEFRGLQASNPQLHQLKMHMRKLESLLCQRASELSMLRNLAKSRGIMS